VVGSICGPTCGFPLFLHVLGAIVLFGGIAAVTLLAAVSLRRDHGQAAMLRRLAFMSTLLVVWPGWLAMRIAGQWVLGKYPGLEDSDPAWLGIGFIVGDLGLLVLIATTILAWFAYRRTRPDRPRPVTAPILAGLVGLYLLALAVAMFAMSAKPGS
jgi:putative copper export protein